MRLLNRTAGRLSRHRRRPVAALLVLLLGLFATGTFYAAFAPAQAETTASDAAQVEEGRELFLIGCAFCHGTNGEGVLTESGTQYGPALAGVGAAAVDFQVGTGRMPLVQPGQQAPSKPTIYSDEEIEALGAFVASLGPGPSVPEESEYSVEGLSADEQEEAVVRGGEIFRTNCTACHNFDGAGGAMPRGGYAPSLKGVEPKYIYEALLTGPQSMPTFSNGNLTPEDKRDVIAYLQESEEQPTYGGFGLGSMGPVAEGLFAWVVGIGGLVGFAIWIAAHSTRSLKQKGTTE